LPGYAEIGVLAPILLVVLRMAQGFSTGGEIGGAASYIREWAAADRRAFYISFIPSAGNLGKGAAAGIAAIAASLMSDATMESWGWRIPFLLAIPLAALVLYMRLQVEDSPEYVASKAEHNTTDTPIAEVFRHYKAPLAKVTAISLVQNIGTYVGTVFVAVYFSNVLGFSKGAASTIVLVAVLLAAVLIPIAGQIGTRVGAKRILLWSYLAYLVITIPSFMLMNQHSVGLAMLGLAIGMIPYALCQAGTYSVIPEFYPVKVRHTGVAFGHSVGAVIGGGGGPYLATWLTGVTGSTFIPAYILILAGALGLAVLLLGVRRNTTEAGHLYR